MNLLYTRHYKFANLLNILVFVVIVAGVSMLYGKLQVLQTQASTRHEDHDRLLQHEDDLSDAQATINRLTLEIEALRHELEAQRKVTPEASEESGGSPE